MAESKDFPDCFYRVTVKGLCVRDDKLLMVRESPSEINEGKSIWELPGGGLDFGEDIETGLRREVQEEMGLTVRKMSEQPIYAWTHKFEKRRRMEWFYVLVLAYQVEFEHLNFTPSDECVETGFFSKEELGKVNLNGQMAKLLGVFDPRDFANTF